MEAASMPSRPPLGGSNFNPCQDAREGGANPPLPRNCKRTFSLSRRLDSRNGQQDQPERFRSREAFLSH